MDVTLLVIRLILFSVFALAAIGKFLDFKGAEKAVKDFGTPDELAKPFAIALPFAEIVFAFCFLFTSTAWAGAVGGLILLLSFTGGMIWQMARGNAPDCHCFGQIHSEPVSSKTLVRNIIFSLLAVVLVVRGRDGQGIELTSDNTNDTMSTILIFVVLAVTAAALFYLKRILDNQTEILRRIELLEVIAHEGVPVDRSDAGHPHDGLPIGSPFPDFDLKNTSGERVNLTSVLKGRPAILFFVSATCEPCKALLPEMEQWDAELGDRINFALLSSGASDANREKFAGVFADEVVLQEKREIAEAVHARWTPTALFVRADGTIGSHLAAGDNAIRELVDNVRTASSKNSTVYFTNASNNGTRAPKIGEEIPDFSLADVEGHSVTADDIRGRRTLAVFWSPTCPHCQAMMGELKAWDKGRGPGDPGLIVFSDGSKDEHNELGLNAPVVIDPGYKMSAELGMFGTPSAVMFDEHGRFLTETGVGASNIWALLGKRR